jgi:hypothetical protein
VHLGQLRYDDGIVIDAVGRDISIELLEELRRLVARIDRPWDPTLVVKDASVSCS